MIESSERMEETPTDSADFVADMTRVSAGRRNERREERGGQKRAATGKAGVRLHKMSRCENTRGASGQAWTLFDFIIGSSHSDHGKLLFLRQSDGRMD